MAAEKTTLAKTIVKNELQFINADDIKIAKKISDLEAGKIALYRLDDSIKNGSSFAFETTMAGLGLMKRFKRMKEKKYSIEIFYLFAHPVDLLKERIKERLKKGGHPVEEEDIVRRYYRSAKNFWNKYRHYASEWIMMSNNEFRYKNVATGKNGAYSIIDNAEFEKFKEVLTYEK